MFFEISVFQAVTVFFEKFLLQGWTSLSTDADEGMAMLNLRNNSHISGYLANSSIVIILALVYWFKMSALVCSVFWTFGKKSSSDSSLLLDLQPELSLFRLHSSFFTSSNIYVLVFWTFTQSKLLNCVMRNAAGN